MSRLGVGVPKSVGAHYIISHFPNAEHETTRDNVCPAGFCLDLVKPFDIILLFLPFGMGMFSICHFVLGMSNLFFILQRLIAMFTLSLRIL
jgi:hypothetical protein